MDRSSNDCTLLEPKIESPDTAVRVNELQKFQWMNTTEDSTSVFWAKRPRGRPRKYPIQSLENSTKGQKLSSRTCCLTCKRRKKKCDGTKSQCLNCGKNAVICEGYPIQIMRSGDAKDVESATVSACQSPIRKLIVLIVTSAERCLPTIKFAHSIRVETMEDRIFFEHYWSHLSTVLTVERPGRNAFRDILLPLAIQHLELMHFILILSSTSINYRGPYGMALLNKYCEINEEMLRRRSEYHKHEALKALQKALRKRPIVHDGFLSPLYGQILCLVVQSMAEGNATGEHQIHLKAYQSLIHESPPNKGPFMDFKSGRSSFGDKTLFQRVDSRPNLASRRPLITTMLHQSDRVAAFANAASKSTPALHQFTLNGPYLVASPDSDDNAPRIIKKGPKPGQEIPQSVTQPLSMNTGIVISHQAALLPKTIRRNMLQTELTASRRRHLLWERQQKNQTAAAVLKKRHTALKQYPEEVYLGTDDKDGDGSWNKYFVQGLGDFNSKGW